MAKFNALGKLIRFNLDANTVTFQFSFLTPEIVEQIENLFTHEGLIKLMFNAVKPFRSKTWPQQKKFWVDFYKILKALKVPKTKDNSDELYIFVKENIFPARETTFMKNENGENVTNYYAPEMKDLSIEEMSKVIQDLHNYYDYLNLNWFKERD